jgi:hypothetical protein
MIWESAINSNSQPHPCIKLILTKTTNKVFMYVRFEVFTAATMKNAIFWDVALCRSCVNWRFRGMLVHTRFTVGPTSQNLTFFKVFMYPTNHVTNFAGNEHGKLPSLVVTQFPLTAIIRSSLHEDTTRLSLHPKYHFTDFMEICHGKLPQLSGNST